MTREWQNRLVDEFLYAVKHENIWTVRMAAHNLAVHIATQGESCAELKKILLRGAGADRPIVPADYDEALATDLSEHDEGIDEPD